MLGGDEVEEPTQPREELGAGRLCRQGLGRGAHGIHLIGIESLQKLTPAREVAVNGRHSDASPRAISTESTWTISGLVRGRPLASKMRATAAESSAFAPNPYTVSVGNATSFPARINAAACSRLTRASRPYRRRRFFQSCATPGRRGSAAPGRLPARGPHRPSPACCAGLSPAGTAPARSCGSGCRN